MAYADEKAAYEYWLEPMTEVKGEGLKEFRVSYKKCRDPDVLTYCQTKKRINSSGIRFDELVHQCFH